MSFSYKKNGDDFYFELSGDMTRFEDVGEQAVCSKIISEENIKNFYIESHQLVKWNSQLVAFLYKCIRQCKERKIPVVLNIPVELKRLLDLSFAVDRNPVKTKPHPVEFLEEIGIKTIKGFQIVSKGFLFFVQCICSIGRLFSRKAVMRFYDFVSALYDCGPKALLIVSLISFMVGLILAFVGSIQLKTFGAQIYVASLVTIGMIRIMGAIMVGIIMAGRTGASYAATIGTMQVNEELDALKTMGVPVIDFLVLPRLASLVISMPILVMLADFMGMLGGAFVGTFLLDISVEEYWNFAWRSFGLQNFLVGIFHGFVFGFVISLCGCYYGVNCGRNADSVGQATTKAVVSSIVWMIVLTGIITFICEVVGI